MANTTPGWIPSVAKCRWCTRMHGTTHLCAPAKEILDALYAKGRAGDMPTIEFDDPIWIDHTNASLGLGPDDRLVAQVVIKAITVPVAGVKRAGLIFTGREPSGRVLPNWLYAGDDDELANLVKLVADTADMAIRAARR